MSYQSISKPIMHFLKHFEQPKVLEIGLDKGQTAIPICHNLSLLGRPFSYTGIDIKISEYIQTMFISMDNIKIAGFEGHKEPHNFRLFQKNSLEILPVLINAGQKFNLILLDGDHNYYTVSRELKMLQKLCLPSTLIVCDDYNTKWAYKDLYYSEYKEYQQIERATRPKNTEKAGVRTAIDEFVQNSNGVWGSWHPPTSTGLMDYCILYQPDNILGARFDNGPDEAAKFASCQTMKFIFNESNCKEVMALKQKGE